MKYAMFLGCKIPSKTPEYAIATRVVLGRLGVELIDLNFTCCGYPMRSRSRDAFVVSSARNLALAGRQGLNLLTPCQCCFGTLRHAQRFLSEDVTLRERVATALAGEGLDIADVERVSVEHLLPVLGREIGLEKLASAVTTHQNDTRIAAHYGCHALRPSGVTGFDNPVAPTLFEKLIAVTGATPVEWARRLDCCGEPVRESNPLLSQRMATSKVTSAVEAGADTLAVACPYCFTRLSPLESGLRTLFYPQLLGLAMGIAPADLGM